ncbi:MAG: GyrI-like domain-containing protein [Planctomycetota bacterium]|nr:GyrI-like domain-containing protein [Planctomycetota bacterium]
MNLRLIATLALVCLAGCKTRSDDTRQTTGPELAAAVRSELDLPVSEPPHTNLKANWKERIEERYAFIELVGSYTETGQALGGIFQMLASQDIEPTGAPFALFYDDPGHTAVSALRSRACVPIPLGAEVAAPYQVDTLPSTMVVYAYVGGAYGEVPRAYPGLYAYMKKLGWKEAGPIRESYLVSPTSVKDFSKLVTEVQIPAQSTR